jgi:hypothetical protein
LDTLKIPSLCFQLHRFEELGHEGTASSLKSCSNYNGLWIACAPIVGSKFLSISHSISYKYVHLLGVVPQTGATVAHSCVPLHIVDFLLSQRYLRIVSIWAKISRRHILKVSKFLIRQMLNEHCWRICVENYHPMDDEGASRSTERRFPPSIKCRPPTTP